VEAIYMKDTKMLHFLKQSERNDKVSQLSLHL